MNKKYDVVWSNIAENDLKKIVEYIADDSPPNALKIFKRIKQKASSLYTFPEKGRIVPELRDQGILQYRELVISPWRILYRISEKSVLVSSVLDSRRNIEDILLKGSQIQRFKLANKTTGADGVKAAVLRKGSAKSI